MDALIAHTLFGASGTAVLAAATLTSPVIDLQYVERIEALRLKASSVAGTANVKAQYQTSHDGVNWDAAADNPLVITASLTDKPGNTEGWNGYAFPAPLARYVRILVVEQSSGSLADTIVEARLLCRERLG
jgi:hypothetical protein